METAVGIPFIKSSGVDGVDFDLLPRKGLHTNPEVEKAKKHIRDSEHMVSEIRVTWLPQQYMSYSHNKAPHFLVRIQNPSGGLNPFKRAIWASFDFEEYNIKLGLYDLSPDPSNLLPEARIIFSDGENQYTVTGGDLFSILESDKTIQKKKLK